MHNCSVAGGRQGDRCAALRGLARGGYIRSLGGGLTHMTVGGAGHLVPMDQPERAQDMIQRFVRGQL